MKEVPTSLLDLHAPPLVVGTVSTVSKLGELSQGGKVDADIVELRMDLFEQEELDWEESLCALDECGVKLLLTLRHKDEGGRWDGSPVQRMEILRFLLPFACAVDVEIGTGGLGPMQDVANESETCLIGSFHDFEKTPVVDALSNVIEIGFANGADLVKIATLTESESDVEVLAALLQKHSELPLAVLGMGTLGPETRVQFPRIGSRLTYGYLDESAAPGQIYAGELQKKLADP
jgi:3-dehydroquinate dehydratase type I